MEKMKQMALQVIGNRVLIRPKELESMSKGGIAISYGSNEKIHKMASQEGEVVQIGPESWSDYKTQWCSVGDKVIFAQYSGKFVTDPETEEDFIVINDEDIQVIIK